MNLMVRSISWIDTDRCQVEFAVSADQTELADFRLNRTPVAILVNSDSDVLRDSGGSAAEIRAINDLIVRFCLSAQGELPEA